MFHVLLIYTIDEIYDSLEAFKWLMLEKFENTKGEIKRCKSKEYGQHNGQKKKDKRTNNDLQNTTR
jgi:hypothetical protein